MSPSFREATDRATAVNRVWTRARKARRVPRRARRVMFERLEERLALAAFTVDTTADTVAVAPVSDGKDAAGQISLRSAIQAANSLGGNNSINLPAATYNLTMVGAGEDNAVSGDLDIKSDLTIIGTDAATTIVAARAPGPVGAY